MNASGFFVLVGQDGVRWPLGPEPIVIGRTADSTIQLTDLRVSRTHARVWRARGRCWVRDEKTTHGTYVNEQRLSGERELRLGDHVRIADTTLRLALASEPVANRGCLGSLKERISWRTALLAAVVGLLALLLILLALLRPWDRFSPLQGPGSGQVSLQAGACDLADAFQVAIPLSAPAEATPPGATAHAGPSAPGDRAQVAGDETGPAQLALANERARRL